MRRGGEALLNSYSSDLERTPRVCGVGLVGLVGGGGGGIKTLFFLSALRGTEGGSAPLLLCLAGNSLLGRPKRASPKRYKKRIYNNVCIDLHRRRSLAILLGQKRPCLFTEKDEKGPS